MCSTSINSIRFYDRDVSAALNIRRIAAGPGRPRELSSWLGRPAMPNPGRPGQEWVLVRDRGLLRKRQRRHQRQRHVHHAMDQIQQTIRLPLTKGTCPCAMSFELYRQTMMGGEPIVWLKSMLDALRNHVTARAQIKANLKTYRFFDNVWQFMLENVNFKLLPSGTGPPGGSADVRLSANQGTCQQQS
ncbi:hypothetical protein QJQ45_027445 [Haematococcus lacustris]|nr:hypothetical protein QJQ45_027445 [Haematococcus lacustris]